MRVVREPAASWLAVDGHVRAERPAGSWLVFGIGRGKARSEPRSAGDDARYGDMQRVKHAVDTVDAEVDGDAGPTAGWAGSEPDRWTRT